MRHFLPYCLLALAIASCGVLEQPQAAPPLIAPPTMIVLPPPTTMPTIKTQPTPRPSTPLPDSPNPTFTQANAALPLDDLLFQAGDLPDPSIDAQVSPELAEWAELKLDATGGAVVSFERDGKQKGRIEIFFYATPLTLKRDYAYLLDSLSYASNRVPQQGIGEKAMLLIDNHDQARYSLIFTLCRTIATIRLQPPIDQQTILAYGARLAQRIDAVDCQGAAHAPLQTPAIVAAPATPFPTAAVVAHNAAQVLPLADANGATTIRAYTFADPDHGWLALGATILATSDGGTSWHEQYRTDSVVKTIRFVSAQRGWIETERGYILTEDGGATWQHADTEPAGSSTLMAASDSVRDNHDFPSYHFCPEEAPLAGKFIAIDALTGWTFCTNGPEMHFDRVRLFSTSDGGTHWTMISDAPPYGRHGIANVVFLDARHGWISTTGGLYATSDGGSTWADLRVPGVEFETRIRDVRFLSRAQGFVILPNGNLSDSLLQTQDGGTTWQKIFISPPPTLWPDGPVQFFSDSSGIGTDSDSTFLKTADGGATWTMLGKIDSCGTYGHRISGISFPDQQNGWATANCGDHPMLYRTSNGGITWAQIASLANVTDDYATVTFIDTQVGYLVGDTGHLLRSDDGGMTWALIPSNLAHAAAIRFVTSDTGWELHNQQLFMTRDGGQTWGPIGIGAPIRQFWLLPDGHAWAIADGGERDHSATRLFTTVDGGQTWSESVLTGIRLAQDRQGTYGNQIQFTDANQGWLRVGVQLYTTQDAGQSWVQVH
jgi:photosystem II stability/assembly factor-like uncharacterized protein